MERVERIYTIYRAGAGRWVGYTTTRYLDIDFSDIGISLYATNSVSTQKSQNRQFRSELIHFNKVHKFPFEAQPHYQISPNIYNLCEHPTQDRVSYPHLFE